jgi:hypothetical protein
MNRAQRRAASRRDRPRRIPLPTARPLSLQRVEEIIEEMYDAKPESMTNPHHPHHHLRVGIDSRGSTCWEVADDQGQTVGQHASGRDAAEACRVPPETKNPPEP